MGYAKDKGINGENALEEASKLVMKCAENKCK